MIGQLGLGESNLTMTTTQELVQLMGAGHCVLF